MDLWVVAAAAGAGYVGKYWKRLSKNSDISPHLSSEDSNLENREPPSSPVHRQARRGRFGKEPDGLLEVDSASRRGLDSEKVGHFRNYNEGDVSKLPVSFSANEKCIDVEDGNEQTLGIGGSCSFLLPDSSAGEVSIRNPLGNKTSLRTKRMYGGISRPLNSSERRLAAQLYEEHAEIEEQSFSSLSSTSRATRSFLVGDGRRIISRENDDDSFCAFVESEEDKLWRETGQLKDESVLFGVPSLLKIGSSNDVKKKRFNADNARSGRLSSSNDATYLFSLGISFGIAATILENKREMDKLRELLKQNENLVQDLQEELDMKDSMTVKELLHSANYGSQDTCDHSFCDKELNESSPEKHTGKSPLIDPKEEDNSESMSKIEAELEAELERLGLNMNESSLERRLSELVEVDPDFVADFAQGGELRADMVSGEEDLVHPKSDEDTASDHATFPANYAVSPHELSLRLHEVIESRLEERVHELELALQNSQRKLQSMESEHAGSRKYFQSNGQASAFIKGNKLTYDDCDPIEEQPLVMNLSDEALGAHDEAYEVESIKIYYDSEENSPLRNRVTVFEEQHGGANGPITRSAVDGERLSRELSSGEATMLLEGQSSSVNELDDDDGNGDEDCDFDSEMERQLIRRIVERTKKGSPVLQNALKDIVFYG